jgi:Flp pilus assembly protein TadD
MNAFDPSEQLLANLLNAAQRAEPSASPSHPDDELLALFAAGELKGEEHDTVVEHVADCEACRRIVAVLLTETDRASSPLRPSRRDDRRLLRWSVWAVAASFLLTMGVWVYRSDQRSPLADARVYAQANQLLANRQFGQAQQVLQEAERRRITSDRLRSLQAQAERKIPDAMALAYAGRLTDFGYDVGGVVARGPAATQGLTSAREILENTHSDKLEVLLNRGHLYLSIGELELATADFQKAAELEPSNAWCWVGLGLRAFLANDLEAAETHFRRALHLEDRLIAARVNLAFTLEEQGRATEALAEWRALESRQLVAEDQELVTRAIKHLEPQ